MRAAWLAVSLTLSIAGRAEASRARLAVMPSVIKEADVLGDLNASEVYEAALRGLQYVVDVEPVAREELEGSVANAQSYCGSDVACLSARLRSAEIKLALEVIVNQSADPVIVTAQLIDTEQAASLASEVVQAERGLSATQVAVTRIVEKLAGAAKLRIGGRARIAVVPGDARVTVEPAAAEVAEDGRSFVALPGIYKLTVARDGFEPVARDVVLRAGETSAVDVTLAESGSSSTLWIVAGIGAVVVAAGTVAAIALSGTATEYSLCQAPGADASMCPR